MTYALIRKARQVVEDPVLRHWLIRRAGRLNNEPPPLTPGVPPYLAPATHSPGSISALRWTGRHFGAGFRPAEETTIIDLPGMSVELSIDNPVALFNRQYADLETLLAAHRFAWLPLAGPDVDPNWVAPSG